VNLTPHLTQLIQKILASIYMGATQMGAVLWREIGPIQPALRDT
jgi:hypothetical protein